MWAGRLDEGGNEEEGYAGAGCDVELLDMAVADLQLTAEERVELRILAFFLTRSRRPRDRLGPTGVSQRPINAAVAGSIVTADELFPMVAAVGSQFQPFKFSVPTSNDLQICRSFETCQRRGHVLVNAGVLSPICQLRSGMANENCGKAGRR
jgi:hypothetical protein